MTKSVMRQFLCLVSMLFLCIGNVFSQNVVNLGSGLNGAKYYESMNAANPPVGEWYAVDFDDSGWNTYSDPLDYPEYDAFWVRRLFWVNEDPSTHNFQISLSHDREAQFYINGQLFHSDWGCGRNNTYGLSSSYLVAGLNVLAVYAHDEDGGDRYLDCSINTTDGSNIIMDLPSEPLFILSNNHVCLYTVEGYSEQVLSARMITSNGLVNTEVSWTTSNADVVDVVNGEIVALSVGNAVVTATTTYNGVSYSQNCEVEVRNVDPESKIVFVDVPGTLGSLLTAEEKDNVDNLTIFGKLDGSDIQVLRYMAGRNERGNRTPGVLADLDMYNVEFVYGTKSDFRINNNETGFIEPGIIPYSFLKYCATLNSIILPKTVYKIGSYAFYECTNLQNVEISNNISEIGNGAFENCNNLKTIKIPSSISSIESNAFYNCRKLESVSFEEGTKLTSISNWSFYHTNLRTITIPASITSIGEYSFYNIENLNSVVFETGSQLVEMKRNSFDNCYNLQSIELPEGCLEIGESCFRSCSGLTNVTIPTSLISIENEAFRYCNSLSTVNIPQNSKLTSVGMYAFDGTNVTSFYIPKGLTSISDVFSNTSNLQSLTVHPDNRYYESVGGIVYAKRDHSVVLVPKSIDGFLSFPDYVTNLPENLLKDCTKLRGVILHSGITGFGANAFSGCSGLQTLMMLSSTPANVSASSLSGINKSYVTLVVPQGCADAYRAADVWKDFENIQEASDQPIIVLSAGNIIVYDVSDASSRTSTVSAMVITKDGISNNSITWTSGNDSIATVSDGVIEYAGEGSTTITASVTIDGYTATASCDVTSVGMSEGKLVYVNAGNLSTLLTDEEKDDLTHLIVMGRLNDDDIRVLRYMAGADEYGYSTAGSLEVLDMGGAKIVYGGTDGYLNKDNYWRRVDDNRLGSDIFRECNSLKKVILPSSLTHLGSYAFYDCRNLEEVVLPDGLTNIEYEAFRDCRKLSAINIPSSVTYLSGWIFYGCSALKSIDLSTMTGVNGISEYMFYHSGLTSVRIPANIVNIGNGAFLDTPLRAVEFENGSKLTTIAESAFSSTQLQSITIPASVVRINNNAFNSCYKLSVVNFEDNNKLTSIGESVFNGCPIKTFTITKKLQSLGYQSFSDSLKQIVVEEGNRYFENIDGVICCTIDNSLVYVPKNQTSIYLPDYVTVIKNGVLSYHHELRTVVLTSGISDLGESPFYDDYNLTEIYCMNSVPPTVSNLTNGWNGDNKKIYIPVGSKDDYEDARWDSYLLEERSYTNSVVISASDLTLYNAKGGNRASLTSKVFSESGPIKYSTVEWESSDTTVVVVDSDGYINYAGPGTAIITASTTISGNPYSATCAITSIELSDPANAYYLSGQGNDLRSLIGEDNKYNIEKLVLVGKMSNDDRLFIREISCERWDGSQYVTGALKYLDMSELVDTIIGSDAFEDCKSLEKVLLPNNIQLLGSEAFAYCNNLSSIIFPEGIKELGWGALRACNGLKSVEFLGMNAPRLSEYVFGEIGSSYCVVVPTGSKGYKTDDNWNRMTNVYEKGSLPILVLEESDVNLYNIVQTGVNELQLKAYAIMSDGMISTDLIWESSDPQIAKVDSTGFLKYVSAGNAVITASVTNNGKTVSAQCDVKSYAIDDAEHAYYLTGQGNLRSLIGQDDKYNIEKLVLVGKLSNDDRNFIREISCNRWEGGQEVMGSLKYLDMSELVDTIIGADAFDVCNSLETVILPKNISIIESGAFATCSNLTSLMFPESITRLGSMALYACKGLRVIQFLGVNAPQLSDNVFGQIGSDFCVIVPSGATDYQTKDYWKDMTNVYSADILPIMVLDEKKVELYNVSEEGMNKHQLTAYAITVDGITTDVTWSSSNDSIVTVTGAGLIMAGNIEGQATVTATYTSLGKTVSVACPVSVVDVSDFTFVNVAVAGTLSDLIPEDEVLDIKKLLVLGSLNGDDIRVLRKMAGRDENGNLTAGSLEILNMYNTKIVSGGEGYYYKDSWWRYVSENSFGSDIFRDCNSLKKVILPSSLTYLGAYAFYGCQNLEEVVLSDGLTNIEHQAFYNCRKLTAVNIPSSVTYLSSWIFYGCINLKSIDLSTMTGVNTIPEYMFYESGLTNVIIPSNITNISYGAFQNTPLKSVQFESGSKLATIGEYAFQSTQLQSITIPASVTSINNYAFNNCQKLTEVLYENNNKLTSIGDNVFNDCPIQTFIIPKYLISMGNQGFSESLSEIVVEEGNKFFELYDGALCCKSEGTLIYVPKNKTSIFLPEYVTSLKNGVLRYHYNLETVVLSSQISDLGDQPFWSDNKLKEVYCMTAIPPRVRYLSDDWYGDRKIYIPAGSREAYIEAEWDSTLLEERVFEYGITLSTGNMKLYNVNGGNERELSALVFTPAGPSKSGIVWSTSDSSIVSVSNSGVIRYLNEGEAIITASAVFADTIVSAECRVNNLRLDAGSDVYYVTAGNLSTLIPESRKYEIRELILLGEINADDIRFIREMAGIDNNNNKTDGKLARLNLEAVNVVYGGNYWSCHWGTSYNDDNKLGAYAFADCKSLEEVVLPSNLTSLRDGVFYECDKLRSVTLPSLISNIPSYTFYNCKQLTNVYIPENVNYINYCAFASCTSLKSVISLCNNPANMDWSAFNGLTKGNITLLVPSGTYKAYSSNDDWKEFRSITEMDQLPMLILGYNSLNLYNFNTIGAADRTIPATVVTKYGVSDVVVTWNSSNPDAVTVNNGHVAMTATPGSSVITATAIVDGVTLTATCNVTTNVIDTDNAYYVEAGNLPNLIPESQKDSIKKLVLFGELNGTDIRFIREMAGISEYYWGNPGEGSLEYLDLSNAKIVSGGRDYGEAQYIYNDNGDWSSRWEYTEDDVIGNGMFRKSNSLKTIILPQNIKKIGSYAFDESPKLEEVFNMPLGVTELSSRALYGFDVVYTSNLTPVELENSSLLNDGSVIVVPAASLETYKTADNWKEFKSQIIPDNIQTVVSLNVTAEDGTSGLLAAAGGDANLAYIMDLTLSGTINGYDIAIIRNRMPILRNLDLTNVRIVANPFEYYTDSHSENNRLGRNAFRELDNLRRVILPKSIDYVGDYAFYECNNLKSVKMYEGLNTIDNYAFAYCPILVDVELPEGLLSIGSGAFQSCSRLEEITIPSTLLTLGNYAFNYCTSLKSIVLPKNLSRIEWETFWYCSSLESVILPAKVNRIEYYAFYGCSKLKELRLPPMIESIGDRAFYECGNIKDVYVYIANSKDIKIDMNTFSCFQTATLHIPTFSYESYYWDTQWMQFYEKKECQETYDEFYTKNTLLLNHNTGTIDGDPDAVLYEKGGLVVDSVKQVLDVVELKSDGTDGASLIASGTGNIVASKLTININVTAYRWHFFSFPFDVPLDSIHYDGEYVWRQYDGQARSRREGGWQDLATGTTTLSKGRGYIFQGTMTGSLSFTIDNPDLTAQDETTGLFTHESDNVQDANWNFVGNPYTSYYNIDETTYSAPITIWTGSAYEAYRPGDDDYDLAPYQAFFVQTPEDANEISFSADGRESYEDKEAAQSGRLAARRVRARNQAASGRLFINLEITADGESSYADKTRVVFNNSKSMDYELSCDAAKFFSDESTIELYSLDSNGAKYSINERPVGDGNVNLGIKVNVAGTYTIGAVRMDTPVLLYDKKLNVTHDLSEGGYAFWAEEGESQRFVLKTSDSSVTKVMEVKSGTEKEDKIYDLQGRQLDDPDAKGVIIINGKKVLGNN